MRRHLSLIADNSKHCRYYYKFPDMKEITSRDEVLIQYS